MSENLRCFIAVDLDRPVRELISEIRGKLASIDHLVKWVAAGGAHITLKFLGNIAAREIPRIQSSLGELAQRYEKTTFTTTKVGAFPDLRHPRIIFLDIQDNHTLQQLARSIEADLAYLKINDEGRNFTPHITLGRVKSPEGASQIAKALQQLSVLPPVTQDFKSIKLFKSSLGPKGPTYTCLMESLLKEPHRA